MFLLRIILFPFSVLFDLITRIRNHLYNLGLKPSTGFDVPTICVGNLSVGGTGKTPMVEYLFKKAGERKVAILSRGYGRKTRGIRIAGEQDTALTLGDEPFQFYRKFKTAVIAVGEDRVLAIPEIMQHHPDVTMIILDDAFQHRRIKPSFSVLLTDYSRPFYHDMLLPAGRLREARSGAARADVIVVTKCPHDLSDDDMMEIKQKIQPYTSCPVFFAGIEYGQPVSFGGHQEEVQKQVILVTGIAHAGVLRQYVEDNYTLIDHIAFGDHHHYTEADMARLNEMVGENTSILTTEKDMVKMIDPRFSSVMASLPLFYIPIQTVFIKNGEEFDALVQTAIHHAG